MPIRKIITVKNVGRFLSYNASGDVSFKRFNLIFAENGRGKTTICDIFRSARSGDPAFVMGRRTLGSGGAPEINLLTDVKSVVFAAGHWNITVPELVIFDTTFVSENVYSGDAVDLGHRRNLYRVIIGKDGVDLARRVDELDADIRVKTAEIRDRRAYVQSMASQGISIEDFMTIGSDPNVDEKIIAVQKDLDSVRQIDQLKARATLQTVLLPRIPNSFESVLASSIATLVADAGTLVANQIKVHGMQTRGEIWLSEGRQYVRDDKCPFCDQGVAGSTLIEAYNAHFSGAYEKLKQDIEGVRSTIEDAFGDRAIAEIERAIDRNNASVDFWERYCNFPRPQLTAPLPVGDSLRVLRREALRLLDQKKSSPTEPVFTDLEYSDALKFMTSLTEATATYNAGVAAANAVIDTRKAASGKTDTLTVEGSLRRLRDIQLRHQPDTVAACEAYIAVMKEKEALEIEKAAARAELDEHTKDVIGRYEKTINDLLEDFQAGFRITETKHIYPGGVPSSSFQILINETPVELGDASTPSDRASFRNTLSSGDKSTLALAFFLAQIENDKERQSKIVVFDDPFNSQDAFRRDHTAEKIRKCGERCAQVIVLSHDPSFLKRVWDRLSPQASELKTLQFTRVGIRNTKIAEWDIEVATQQRFKADQKALAEFYHTAAGEPRDIVAKLRPVLETYCRNLSPSEFLELDMLASIVTKIRKAGPSHYLASAVEDMDAINIYTRRYHHGEGPQPATEAISDSELQGFVKKTLAITGYN